MFSALVVGLLPILMLMAFVTAVSCGKVFGPLWGTHLVAMVRGIPVGELGERPIT